ncbi:sensor histidine kinase [Planomonospora corallina]|uniref:histidine kinase n=1 Tax=Planomonospora corallina TaxID=1806052 RepID=A0ABV8IHK9_9ACTN
MVRRWFLLGESPLHAARQLALLLAVGALLTVVKLLSVPAAQQGIYLALAALQAAAAAAAWCPIWRRLPPQAPLVLTLPAFTVLATSIWAAGGVAAAAAPFFVLVFVWIGLHFPARTVLAVTPVALAAYLGPMLLAGRDPAVITSAILFIPTLTAVAVMIARQVDHHRRDRDALRRAERWRAALTSTLAHDVRSPLTSVRFVLETLHDEAEALPPDQRRTLIETALRQAARIHRLAAGLLDADRIDAEGRLRLETTSVPLRSAIDDALAYLTTPITVHLAGDVKVRADPARLEQILINLLTNAVRHGEPPITVTVRPAPGAMVAIDVRDHGPGVPPGRRQALFSRFSGTDAAPGSVGLGLWIARELARAHGGDVTYHPADPGTRFTVTLPAVDPAPPPVDEGARS